MTDFESRSDGIGIAKIELPRTSDLCTLIIYREWTPIHANKNTGKKSDRIIRIALPILSHEVTAV